jgi:hypothetical protein
MWSIGNVQQPALLCPICRPLTSGGTPYYTQSGFRALEEGEDLSQFLYTVWLRDHDAEQEDPDREYPACIAIEAENAVLAREWGDKLAGKFLRSNRRQEFMQSQIEPLKQYERCDLGCLPFVRYGDEPTDEQIGW